MLQRALTIRLNMQISLSALPIVEEWMDIHLTRWLESVPLPPEMPSGHSAHFSVTVASDLSRLTWGAYGNPAGFIPKMAKYLEACRIAPEDVALIDALGNDLEPALVGSWIAVEDGQVSTGWQFCDEHEFARVAPQFSDSEAKATLMAWLDSAGVTRFRRFVQTIGDDAASYIELPVPGVAIDDRLDAVSEAFRQLAGQPLPEHAVRAFGHAATPTLAVGVRIRAGVIDRVAAIAPGIGNDVVATLCQEAGIGFSDRHPRMQASFGADGPDGIVYTQVLPQSDGAPSERVDVIVIPSGGDAAAPDQSN